MIATDIAPHAAAVDRDGRFPAEAIDGLRRAGLLGATVPTSHGGLGGTITDAAQICGQVAGACGSTGLILAMHYIQVACLVDHGQGRPYFDDLLRAIAADGLLLASATSEAGIGGDTRTSTCAVQRDGDGFTLAKEAIVISYGAHADGVLATARTHPDAAANDQVLVHVSGPDCRLEPRGTWDAMGMRGTSSIGFRLEASGSCERILPVPFAEISARTMLPVSHLLWSAVWLGLADEAMARAHRYIRAGARKAPGAPTAAALRFAEVHHRVGGLRRQLAQALEDHERGDGSAEMRSTVAMNNLKIEVSSGVVAAIGELLLVCGIAGYRNDSEYAMGRLLRDAMSSMVMIHNDRLTAANATLLGVMKRG